MVNPIDRAKLESILAEDIPTSPGFRLKGREKQYCCGCSLDVTRSISIRCAVCEDVDLCVECFALGAEVGLHLREHPYHVLDTLDYPLFTADWWADEEIALLEGIEKHGLGSWYDVAVFMGTKTPEDIDDHYKRIYLTGPQAPMPRTDIPIDPVEEHEYRRKRLALARGAGSLPAPVLRHEKPDPSGPVCHELPTYMPLRGEFEVEHDNDAEQAITNLFFNDEEDSPEDIELKLKMLEIYNYRLARRYERRNFLLERGLVNFSLYRSEEKHRSKEERDLINRYKVFSKLQSHEDFILFVEGLLNEHRIRQRIAQLQEYRQAGIRTEAAAATYELDKIARHHDPANRVVKPGSTLLMSGGLGHGGASGPGSAGPGAGAVSSRQYRAARDQHQGAAHPRRQGPLDITHCEGFQLLSAEEARLCSFLRLLPRAYLTLKETLLSEAKLAGDKDGVLTLDRAQALVGLDPDKVEACYHFFQKAGWIGPTRRVRPRDDSV
ncbi:hypothetical protein H696_05368 [Fonticula alba]|uniref:Transcriptional adapter n=1 Tax=Fonticula alba TaxID=691883 RepID=A0A058Z2F9_FONAL|nr:hypothetical protein H696_05368 [Fonticula alba]KCV68113.1 hypothetical protein H696_05368 [Fonticula alba]|eukprot:XP_009497487.1 hypothetical protein H696_05368 [Fonticula alba]